MRLFYSIFFGLLTRVVIAQSEVSVSVADSIKLRKLWDTGDSLIQKGQYIPAKKVYEQALGFAQTTPYPDGIGVAYRALGWWHESIGEYSQAIDLYQKALTAMKSNEHPRNYILTFQYLAFVFNRIDKSPEALRYATEGLALARQKGDERLRQRFYGVLVGIHNHSQRYDSALVYTQKILTYARAHQQWNDYYIDLYNAGLLYKNMGQYARAEKAFRDVLAYAKRAKDDYLAAFVYVSLPQALIPQNKLDEAEQACQKALAWSEKTGTEKHALLEEVNGNLSKLWEKRGDYQKAFTYYKAQMASHDSVFNATKNRQVAELETRYQTREKEENIRQLAATNAHQTRQIWAGAGALVVLTALLGALFFLYERVRKSRQQIAQQSHQLTLMMRELHHRVKNNLAIVSSLLKLQSNRLEDEKAVQAVREGQQRVEAMSLIHQRLYLVDKVTTVNMVDYLADLTESLLRAYDYSADTFDLQLKVDVQDMDVDTALPIGLIINELATNALKYAYTDLTTKRPQLRIALRPQMEAAPLGITLEVQDNGPGIDMNDWQKQGKKTSFGKRLIASLTEQLEGQFEFLNQNGALFRLRIPVERSQLYSQSQ